MYVVSFQEGMNNWNVVSVQSERGGLLDSSTSITGMYIFYSHDVFKT